MIRLSYPRGAGGGGLAFTEVTGTTQAMASGQGYIANNASQVVFTLPTTAPLGKQMMVVGKGAGGWRVNQNAGQQLLHGERAEATTAGTSGYLESTYYTAAVLLTCITADTRWIVTGA